MSNDYISNMSQEERNKNLEKARKTKALKKQLEARGIYGIIPEFYISLTTHKNGEMRFESVQEAKKYINSHKRDLFTVLFHYGREKGVGDYYNESVRNVSYKEALLYFDPFCEEAENLGLI